MSLPTPGLSGQPLRMQIEKLRQSEITLSEFNQILAGVLARMSADSEMLNRSHAGCAQAIEELSAAAPDFHPAIADPPKPEDK